MASLLFTAISRIDCSQDFHFGTRQGAVYTQPASVDPARWRANETPIIGLNPSPKLSAALWRDGALRLVVELADNVRA
jgi:hypothetical protein